MKAECQDSLDIADKVDIVFALDSDLSGNFRKALYPGYKAQRAAMPKSFNIGKVKHYIFDVIFKELDLAGKYGYKFVKVDNAEGDDVIACIMKGFKSKYIDTLLIASDHDFLQIDGIKQVDMQGREVKRDKEDGSQKLSASEFLLQKIILGDTSDNISQVFKRVGPKKALKLINDRDLLKKMLKEDQDAAKQFMMNKKLMSFNEIPRELEDAIVTEASKQVYSMQPINDDLSKFMML
jgi:5'-3' exonuclease